MSRTVLAPELEAEFRAVAAGFGCEVVQVVFSGNILSVMLDHPDGVTLGHCSDVSRQLSTLLDVDDYGRGRYVLEVTSPGLDRPLLRPADWQRFVGRLVRVTFVEQSEGERSKKTIVGRLDAFDPAGGGQATLIEQTSETVRGISLADIERARLEIEI